MCKPGPTEMFFYISGRKRSNDSISECSNVFVPAFKFLFNMRFLQKNIVGVTHSIWMFAIENGISFNFGFGRGSIEIIIVLEYHLKLDHKTNPNWKRKYLFLKQDRINCYSFSNEISKRISVNPIYIFGCFKSFYHGDCVLPALCADRLRVAGRRFSLINLSILRFQQQLVMRPFNETFRGNFQHPCSQSPLCSMLVTWNIHSLHQETTRGLCFRRYVLLVETFTDTFVYLLSEVFFLLFTPLKIVSRKGEVH